MCPVKWVRGSLSGRQNLAYNGGQAYDIAANTSVSADNYQPRFIAKVLREPYANRIKYFQVRTKSTVNMTTKYRHNLALMGGVGALVAALLSDKSAQIYVQCIAAVPKGQTLRGFISPILRAGLDNKDEIIAVAENVNIVNPWVSSQEPNLTVNPAILTKYQSELS